MEKNKLAELKDFLSTKVKLVAVSKYREIEEINSLYIQGQREFGENRVQALLERREALPKDINWHLIGHLQTNKVKYIAPFVSLIHSVDSLKLLKEIQKQGLKNNRIISILFQIHVAQEETKFGFDPLELLALHKEINLLDFPNVQFKGVMTMATNTKNIDVIEAEFNMANSLYLELKENYYSNSTQFDTLSMGMSSDYKTAIKCGSNLVRVGSLLFA